MAISNPTDISNCVLWLQAADLTTLFQNTAGTTPVTADGDPVGTWTDKSGNAFDITAAGDDTTRPTYNITAGVPWITFDGTNDILRRLADLGLYAAGGASMFIAARGNPGLGRCILGCGNTGTNTPQYVMVNTPIDPASDARAFIRNDANTQLLETFGYATGVWDNTDVVFGQVDTGSLMTPWVDGVEGTGVSYTRSGSVTLNTYCVGALLRTTPGSFFATRAYEIACYTKALNDTEAGDLSTYLNAAFSPPVTRKPALTTMGAG